MTYFRPLSLTLLALTCLIPQAAAQEVGSTRPVVALRSNVPDTLVLAEAKIVLRPGRILESASIVIRGQSIIAVGTEVEIPAGAKVVNCKGKTIYPGLIDAYSETDVPEPPNTPSDHWNGNVMPRRSAANALTGLSGIASLRSQGITIQLIAPKGGIIKGSSCAVMLDQPESVSLLKDEIAQHLQLTVPRDKRRDDYPNSPMGAIALVRQTLADARWYPQAWNAYSADPKLSRPDRDDDLAALSAAATSGMIVIDAPNERMAQRAEKIAGEFGLNLVIRGSGREYREIVPIAKTDRTFLVPLDFPDAPAVTSEAAADEVPLRDLMHWHFAPENPMRLNQAGVRFCFTSEGLENKKDFLKNLRVAVKRGLPKEDAIAALTVAPARLLGISQITGELGPGKLANMVLTDGDLFSDDTKILETWVGGKRFVINDEPDEKPDALAGDWDTQLAVGGNTVSLRLKLQRKNGKWNGTISDPTAKKEETQEAESDTADASSKEHSDAGETALPSEQADSSQPKTRRAKLQKVTRALDRLTAWVDLSQVDERLPSGPSRMTIVTLDNKDDFQTFCSITYVDGKTGRLNWQRADPETGDEVDEPSGSDDEQGSDPQSEDNAPAEKSSENRLDQITVNFPLGGYGLVSPVIPSSAVLFRGATVWTCSEKSEVRPMDILVVDGKIAAIGDSLKTPPNCDVIDAKGKHITPGLIDCHSHMATDGGVNESGQVVTAEARIGDFVDNSDINIYRQLAGGLTIANVLHGSANPIGGQNQVIKLRWGDAMDAFKLATAPGGIKFALGENVKRSNRSTPQTRYPATRMGVEQLFRDRFLAAQEYDRRHKQWRQGDRKGLPPRRDLELEAIAEILRGERWIHCHSYRQDEIVALLDLLDEFEIQIGTLQHILEGYKVADRMMEHGAMASAFSDWWAYKFEVYDAIPQNGAIMHDVGITVSFNSDDRELARHMNTEAAKAIKYGNVPPAEALKFVTLNPAMQLRIDDRVGSIEVGKDADIVLWSGPPLSTLSRCEQTWVDGRPMFSLQRDRQLRERDARWRSLLIQKALDEDAFERSGEHDEVAEEDRWLRFDEFCHDHDDHAHDDHDGHHQNDQAIESGHDQMHEYQGAQK